MEGYESYPGRPVRCPEGLSEERSKPIAVQDSAAGIVGGQSGKAIEALQSRKAQETDRPNREAAVEGPNRDRRSTYGKMREVGRPWAGQFSDKRIN